MGLSPFNFGQLERNVEIKIGDEVRSVPMLSINDGRELVEILNPGFLAAEKLLDKAADQIEIQGRINDSRNKAVKFLAGHGIPEDVAVHLEKYASFEEVVTFATYLRTGINMLAAKPEAAQPEKAGPTKKKRRKI